MMETSLPPHVSEYGDVARDRFERVGGPQGALAAESDNAVRLAAADAMRDIGGHELVVRADSEDMLAAAALCRAAGATLLPYPVVDELLCLDGARFALVHPSHPRIDHGDLAGNWLLADLDGISYSATPGRRRPAKLSPFLVEAQHLTAVGEVQQSDICAHLILDSWRLLGAVERALEVAVDHIRARSQFGRPLAEFQAVRFTVADITVTLRGLDEMAKFTLSRHGLVPAPIAWSDALMLKVKAADTAVQAMRTCHQLLGALGFCDESDISVIDRHIQPIVRLPEGTDALTLRLADAVSAGQVETLFS